MKIILKQENPMRTLLPAQKEADGPCRPFTFCLTVPVEQGLLLHNFLTKELLLLEGEEAAAWPAPAGELRQELIRRWYLVPQRFDDRRLALELRETILAMRTVPDWLDKFTVFTTTGCNARCFYCFEGGWEAKAMDPATADKAADFMLARSQGHPFEIDWFGGEPLFNLAVIDRICDRLLASGADFHSYMTTNAFLFDPDVIRRAKERWHLELCNITVDGTEAVYNRVKNFIYPDSNAYRRVMENIRGLGEAGIKVMIRMNLDLYNLEEVYRLTDELIERFRGQENITAYPSLLIEDPDDPAAWRSDEDRRTLCAALLDLLKRLDRGGLRKPSRLSRGLHCHMCMADSGTAVTILPDGRLGLCESYLDSELIGSLDSPDFDRAVLDSFRVLRPEIPACADCPIYPSCLRLQKCPNQICHESLRDYKIEKVKRSMLREWNIYQEGRQKHE